MKKIIKILIFNFLIFSCDKKTDIGIIKREDKNCIEEIEKAKKDFKSGRKTYFLLAGLGTDFNEVERNRQYLKNFGINAEISGVSCIVLENQRANCYELEMNYLYEKELGAAKIKKLIRKSETIFILQNNLKILQSNDDKKVDSIKNTPEIIYPKQYWFSKNQDDIFYYRIHFTIKNKKLELSYPEPLSSKETKRDNFPFDYFLRPQIEKFLEKEISGLNLQDGNYKVIVVLG